MLDENSKQNIRKYINTICQTGVMVINTSDLDESIDFVERLGVTAEAISKQYGMEPELMEGYNTLIKAALKKAEIEKEGITFSDAEQAKEMIYALCDNIDDPKEIMRHVRTADEMMAAWEHIRN